MLLLITIFLLLLLLLFSLTKRKHPSIRKLPGPRPNFFIGNLIDFLGPTSNYHHTLKEYIDKYGTILALYDGPLSSLVLVADEKFLEYILSSTKLIDKSVKYDYLHNWLGTGLLTSTGSKWKKRRRMLTPSFHFSILENFLDVFNSVGDIFIQKLDKHVGKNSLDIYPLVSLCTLDIICEAAMGTSVNAQTDEDSLYVKAVKEMCAVVTARQYSILDPKLYPFTLNYYREKALLKVIHSHTNRIIDERLKIRSVLNNSEPEESGIKGRLAFLDLLLESRIDGMPLSRSDISEEVNTFMFEGHDTTASAVSFTLFSLATHPKVQAKVFEEQYQIFEDQTDRKVTISDLHKMKYLKLVIKETLRLYPPVPVFGRQVAEDFEWEGVLYPRGLTMLLVPFFSHRNPYHFPDPEKFIPERFEHSEEIHPFAYTPFSAGPRNCIGQKFAMLELKSILSKVLRNFELLPARPEHNLKLAPEITLISKNGVRISLRRRNYSN